MTMITSNIHHVKSLWTRCLFYMIDYNLIDYYNTNKIFEMH